MSDERASVLNWAAAVEGQLAERVTIYVSYGTDRSSQGESESNLAVASWDIRTVSLGADFRIAGRSLTLGGAFGWGDGTTRERIDLVSSTDFDPPFSLGPSPIRYRSFLLNLGFEL